MASGWRQLSSIERLPEANSKKIRLKPNASRGQRLAAEGEGGNGQRWIDFYSRPRNTRQLPVNSQAKVPDGETSLRAKVWSGEVLFTLPTAAVSTQTRLQGSKLRVYPPPG